MVISRSGTWTAENYWSIRDFNVPNIYLTINHHNKSQGIIPWRYIGSDQHDRDNYFGSSLALVEDINKLGCENFEKIIIESFKDISNKELRYIEAKHLKEHNVKHDPTFYNLTDVYAPAGGKKGMKHSRKFERSQAWKDSRKNFRYSEESRKKMSLAKLGKKLPEKQKHNMSINNARFYAGKFGKDHPVTGYKHTPEVIAARAERSSRSYRIITPTGEIFEIKNLTKWCKEHNLDYMMVYNSRKGYQCLKMN